MNKPVITMHWTEIAEQIGVTTAQGVRNFANKHRLVRIGAGKYSRRSFRHAIERLHTVGDDSWQQSKQEVNSTKRRTKTNSAIVLDDLLA